MPPALIALTEYLPDTYNIDSDQVYANGYSGGGETMSLALGTRPDLFTAYLHCSSQWDGAYEPVAEAQVPVYLVIGEGDEYYGPGPGDHGLAVPAVNADTHAGKERIHPKTRPRPRRWLIPFPAMADAGRLQKAFQCGKV